MQAFNFIKIVNKNMKRILEGKQLNIKNSNGFLMMRYIFQASGSEPQLVKKILWMYSNVGGTGSKLIIVFHVLSHMVYVL